MKNKKDWYIHVNNFAGYTQIKKDGVIKTTYKDKRKNTTKEVTK